MKLFFRRVASKVKVRIGFPGCHILSNGHTKIGPKDFLGMVRLKRVFIIEGFPFRGKWLRVNGT